MEGRQLLQNLESLLSGLEAGGVQWLNVEPEAGLAKLLSDPALKPLLQELFPPPQRQAPLAPPKPPAAGHHPARPAQNPWQQAAQASHQAHAGPFEPPPLSAQPSAPPPAVAAHSVRPAPEAKAPPSRRPPPQGPAAGLGEKPPGEIATLESLWVQFRNCQRCGLCQQRNKVVFGAGSQQPRLMLVGEGPGEEEDLQGVPFVGRAGKLLTQAILGLGLNREDVYIANVVKCRPPGNRNPHTDEIAACLPILNRQIELLNPALIVALGSVALKALVPHAGGITKSRGQLMEWQGRLLLPTFHPAYLLRNPAALPEFWQDMKLAQKKSNQPA